MRILIIAIAALIVLGGGGAGAYFYLFNNQAEASSGEVEKHHDAKKHAEADKSHFKYVELDPLILPIIDNNGVSQVVNVVVALEVQDEKTAASVEAIAPRIKDAFIQDMYGVLNRHAALKGGVIQVNTLKARLNKISAQVAGEGMINDVLLQVVQQRPI